MGPAAHTSLTTSLICGLENIMTNGKKITAWLALLFIVAVTGLSSPAAAGGAMDQLGVKSTGSKAPAPAPDYGGSTSTSIPWRHMSRDCKGDEQCLAYTGAFRCMTEGARCYDFKAVSAACGLCAYTSQPLKPSPGNFDEGDGYTGIARYDLFFGNKGTAQPNWEKLR